MANEATHIHQANRNQAVLSDLLSSPSPPWDWIATIAFYKAVHMVEAVFSRNESPPDDNSVNHKSRNHVLKLRYPNIWRHYYYLFRASLVARYLEYGDKGDTYAYATFSSFMSDDQVEEGLLGIDLTRVEREASSYLSGSPALNRHTAARRDVIPPSSPFASPPKGEAP